MITVEKWARSTRLLSGKAEMQATSGAVSEQVHMDCCPTNSAMIKRSMFVPNVPNVSKLKLRPCIGNKMLHM